ncbi:hypothetical protein IZY60_14265 [Lutibacter sp. B2]|nr:hypothetical protein [Lutibacter sp. B2]
MFVPPLTIDEVIKATKSAETCFDSKEKQYKYKNDTLIELLEITEEEQRHLISIIGTKEKYYRNNDRRKTERRNSKGLTQKIIAEKLSISIPMVKKYYAKIKSSLK